MSTFVPSIYDHLSILEQIQKIGATASNEKDYWKQCKFLREEVKNCYDTRTECTNCYRHISKCKCYCNVHDTPLVTCNCYVKPSHNPEPLNYYQVIDNILIDGEKNEKLFTGPSKKGVSQLHLKLQCGYFIVIGTVINNELFPFYDFTYIKKEITYI